MTANNPEGPILVYGPAAAREAVTAWLASLLASALTESNWDGPQAAEAAEFLARRQGLQLQEAEEVAS